MHRCVSGQKRKKAVIYSLSTWPLLPGSPSLVPMQSQFLQEIKPGNLGERG